MLGLHTSKVMGFDTIVCPTSILKTIYYTHRISVFASFSISILLYDLFNIYNICKIHN